MILNKKIGSLDRFQDGRTSNGIPPGGGSSAREAGSHRHKKKKKKRKVMGRAGGRGRPSASVVFRQRA